MIKVTIEQTIVQKYEEPERHCVTEKPTEIKCVKRSSYGNEAVEEIAFDRTYEVRMVQKERSTERKIFTQEVPDNEFNIVAVIKAINEIK